MIATAFCVGWVAASASVGAWAALRSARRGAFPPACPRHFVLFRPCAGAEPQLERALLSPLDAPCAVRFLVASEWDAAHEVATRAARRLSGQGRDARVVLTGARGPNRKVDQLARGAAAEAHLPEIVVIADSDVEVTPETLRALLAPLAEAADAAWAPPIETGARTTADHASQAVLDASLHSFALLSALDPRGMVGKFFAIRRDALEEIGGFASLVRYLGEDMELARRLHLRGKRIAVSSVPAASLAEGRSWHTVIRRYARWMTVIRAQRPALLVSYPLLFAAAPIQLAACFAAVCVDGSIAALPAIGVVLVRWSVAVLARVRSQRPLRGLAVAPWLADVTLLGALVVAVSSRTFRWRGVSLRIAPPGLLDEVKE